MSEATPAKRVVCQLRFRLAGEVVGLEASVPDGPSRVADVLPAVQALTSAVVAAAVRRVEREGKAISCAKGCGACCRQPVPVGEAEAIALAKLVAAMPPERQAAVRSRFDAGIARLAEAGLLERARRMSQMPDDEPRHRLGVAYHRLEVACPFLDGESCSIHPHRPVACREYLVTSPAAHCSTPEERPVDRVALPGKVSVALYRFGDGAGPTPPRWMPLLLALEWAAAHRGAGGRRVAGPELFQRFLQHLAAPPRPPG